MLTSLKVNLPCLVLKKIYFSFSEFFSILSKEHFHINYDCWLACSPISCQWSLSTPPENIRKPLVFWCFQEVLKETISVKWVINSTAIYFSKCFILDAWQGYEYATGYCQYVSDQQTRSSQLYLCEPFTTWSISLTIKSIDIVRPENILVTLVMNHQNGYKKQLELQWRT